ncbi:hypothetical protein BVRB_5g106600 [Beta vulgaris subsp. vulgaris]|nr:hypothetical protein BVRB_5g106600 [Beta vulgaris subsp. vulgaris]
MTQLTSHNTTHNHELMSCTHVSLASEIVLAWPRRMGDGPSSLSLSNLKLSTPILGVDVLCRRKIESRQSPVVGVVSLGRRLVGENVGSSEIIFSLKLVGDGESDGDSSDIVALRRFGVPRSGVQPLHSEA